VKPSLCVAGTVLLALLGGCGGAGNRVPVDDPARHVEPLGLARTHPDRVRIVDALRTLERLHDTGALERLRSGECGEQLPAPGECERCPDDTEPDSGPGPTGDADPSEAGPSGDAVDADIIAELFGSSPCIRAGDPPRRACAAECVGPWQELSRVRRVRDELARASAIPRVLEPFAQAVRELSPSPGPDRCDAPEDAHVRAQRAVLTHLFQLDPVPLVTFYADVDPEELSCLRVPTLSGSVPVALATSAPTAQARHGNAVHFIGRPSIPRPQDGEAPSNSLLVEISFFCGRECGGGDVYAVELRGGAFRVVDSWHAWDS